MIIIIMRAVVTFPPLSRPPILPNHMIRSFCTFTHFTCFGNQGVSYRNKMKTKDKFLGKSNVQSVWLGNSSMLSA